MMYKGKKWGSLAKFMLYLYARHPKPHFCGKTSECVALNGHLPVPEGLGSAASLNSSHACRWAVECTLDNMALLRRHFL